MKKNLLICLQCIFLLSGCTNIVDSSSNTSSLPTPSYQIKVTDIDGQSLGNVEIALNNNNSVFEDLKDNFDVDYTTSEYGPYISSINKSVVDANYYISIYENGNIASTGVDGLKVDNGDIFEFKVECWNTIESGYGTLDKYDLMVDKAIYGYMKKLDLSKSTTFVDSSFWDLMIINLAKNNYYDTNLFNFDGISDEIKDEIESYDINTLQNANIYKYYLYSKVLGKDITLLKDYTISYIETLSDDYNDYVTPFIVAACFGMNINSDKINTLVNKEISTNFTWGPDIPVWQYTTSSLYNENIDTSTLSKCVSTLDYGNSSSTALVLQAFAASNENIRDSKYEIDGKDLIEVLFDNYYNEDTNIIEYTKGELNVFSENQVIASLMAYKVCRDTEKKVNIYG